MKKKLVILIILLLELTLSYSQNNVGIGTISPDPNAILEMKATDKGILIPRLTSTQRNNMTPSLGITQKGLLVFDNDSSKFFYWNGIIWLTIQTGPQGPPGIASIQTYGINGLSTVTICSSSYTSVPGLTLNINLIDTATLNIFTYGGLRPSGNSYNQSNATIGVFKNNALIPSAFQTSRIITFSGIEEWTNWSIATVLKLPAGIYTFDVRGKCSLDCFIAGADNNSQSSLIIQVFY